MGISQIVTSAISSILGVFLAGLIVRWQHARADRDAVAGRPVSVPASLRASERRLWRHGSVNIHRDRIVWTPRAPWSREFVLGGVGFGMSHHPVGLMRFLLPPAAVVVPCTSTDRGYELAVLPGSVKYLFWAQGA